MTQESDYLVHRAREVVSAHLPDSRLHAALISGSAALGISDRYSDIDMMLYYDELPTDAEIEAARNTYAGVDEAWRIGDREDGMILVASRPDGIEIQLGYCRWDSTLKAVREIQEGKFLRGPEQKMCSGILHAVPLFGVEQIGELKSQIRHYPESLGLAMIMEHMRIFPIWAYWDALKSRDGEIWLMATIVESVQSLLGILSGMNRVYYTSFQLKHTSDLLAQFQMAPRSLGSRIHRAIYGGIEPGLAELKALVEETRALLAEHYPQVDLSPLDRTLARSWKPWGAPVAK